MSMRDLREILYQVRIEAVEGRTDLNISGVGLDSRKIEGPNDLFVAVPGTRTDGHEFIPQAEGNGAIAIVCEKIPPRPRATVTYVRVKDAREALATIAANYYDRPSRKLELIGVTGTNGKTTTVTLLHELFNKLGEQVGLISTVSNRIGEKEWEASLTTPDPITINALLHRMVQAGVRYCFMEVSSHAIEQKRVSGLAFKGAVFTNITHEHLDYHGTFEAYLKAKKGLFDALDRTAFALVNGDDKNSEYMLQNCGAGTRATYGLKTAADIKGKIIENRLSGLHLNIGGNDVWTSLIGSFNAYNLLAIYGVATLLGKPSLDVLTTLSTLSPVNGRFQYYKAEGGITGIVDFAHSPDALENIMTTIHEIRTGNENVLTVVGCGGDRDKEKRPRMARIACANSDIVILTADNPRSEDPMKIIQEMEKGLGPEHSKKVIKNPDRQEAIRTACQMARPDDIILIAGKGHEKYQEVNGEKKPFDDMAILQEMLGSKEEES